MRCFALLATFSLALADDALYHANGTEAWNGQPNQRVLHANGQMAWTGLRRERVFHSDGRVAWNFQNGPEVWHSNGKQAWSGQPGAATFDASGRVLAPRAEFIELELGQDVVLHVGHGPDHAFLVVRDLAFPLTDSPIPLERIQRASETLDDFGSEPLASGDVDHANGTPALAKGLAYHNNGRLVWNGSSGCNVYHANGGDAWSGHAGTKVYYENGNKAWFGTADSKRYGLDSGPLPGQHSGIDLRLGNDVYLRIRAEPKSRAYLLVRGRRIPVIEP